MPTHAMCTVSWQAHLPAYVVIWTRLRHLGNALLTRFKRAAGSMEELDRAIEINEKAVESMLENHTNRALCFNNLALALGLLFEKTGSMNDLDHAIEITKQVLESTP